MTRTTPFSKSAGCSSPVRSPRAHVVVSDLYSNTQVMTGEVLAGLGSSAAILYYNDTVTYRDGTQEPMDLHVLPMPMSAGCDALMTQAGVGLGAYKTTEQKAEAAALFVRWLTEPERNLDFVAQTRLFAGAGMVPLTASKTMINFRNRRRAINSSMPR